jgi:hypothetical protein
MSDNVIRFLPAALDREVRSALKNAQIYDITSYGWLNQNDPDPNFIGYAMWDTDAPSIDLDALSGEQPVCRRPSEIEKVILTAGTDFTGLMQASRLSIGLALVWHRQPSHDPFGDSPFYWLHHTDAFLKLAIVSDRLRDLLVVACTGNSPRSYKRQAKKNRLFVTPFNEANALLAARGLQDTRFAGPVASLPLFGTNIFEFIDRRNAIVHDVATRMAKLMRDSLSKLQERFDREQINGLATGPEHAAAAALAEDARDRELRDEIDGSLQEIVAWYQLLIRAGNAVFEIEHWSRKLAQYRD